MAGNVLLSTADGGVELVAACNFLNIEVGSCSSVGSGYDVLIVLGVVGSVESLAYIYLSEEELVCGALFDISGTGYIGTVVGAGTCRLSSFLIDKFGGELSFT